MRFFTVPNRSLKDHMRRLLKKEFKISRQRQIVHESLTRAEREREKLEDLIEE